MTAIEKRQQKMERQFNIPNILSIIRILLIPVFVVTFLTAGEETSRNLLAASILLVSGLTDVADGIIARKFGQITDLGKILDPLADKLTQVTVCFCIALRYPIFLILLGVFLIKEICMIIGGAIILKRGIKVQSAKWFGKLSTCAFYVTTLAVIAFPGLPDMALWIMMSVCAVLLLFSFFRYIVIYTKITKQK